MRRTTFALLVTVGLWVLPSFGDARPEAWKKISGENFTVITPIDQKEALAWTNDFGQFIAGLHAYIPTIDRLLPPLTIVVFGRDRDFEQHRPIGPKGNVQEVQGFFWRCDSWSVAALSGESLDEQTRRTFFHESTHWYLSGFKEPRPVWLEEGLAEVFSTFKIDGDKVRFGEPIPEHVVALHRLTPLPLSRLMNLAHADLFTGDSEGEYRTGLAYAESWAFVHLLVFGDAGLPPNALNDYIHSVRKIGTDAAFEHAMGLPYDKVEWKLRAYMEGGSYRMTQRRQTALPAFQVQPATTAEVEEALGEVALAGRRLPEARTHAEAAVAAAGDDPPAYALLGEIAEAMHDEEAAVVAYEKAAERKTRDFRPYFALGALRHRAIMQEDPTGGSFTPADARKIANNYERAINLNPLYEPAYASLAGVVEVAPAGSDADFIRQGAELFPENSQIRLGLAVVKHKQGATDEAIRQLEAIASAPETPEKVKQYANRLETAWTQHGIADQLKALLDAKKFDEADALAAAQITPTTDFVRRSHWLQVRQNIQRARLAETAKEAWNEQRWSDARKAFQEILAADVPPTMKQHARLRLEEMDRRHLGDSISGEKTANITPR